MKNPKFSLILGVLIVAFETGAISSMMYMLF
jgi:hypothetical protein